MSALVDMEREGRAQAYLSQGRGHLDAPKRADDTIAFAARYVGDDGWVRTRLCVSPEIDGHAGQRDHIPVADEAPIRDMLIYGDHRLASALARLGLAVVFNEDAIADGCTPWRLVPISDAFALLYALALLRAARLMVRGPEPFDSTRWYDGRMPLVWHVSRWTPGGGIL